VKLTWKHLRIVMEPSSAVPLATILKNKERFAGKRVGIIITGGNVDLDKLPGMDEADIQTPSLVLDLDALERNIKKMGDYAKAHGMRHRVHGKMHKSVDIAHLQVDLGGACGVCCQKVSERSTALRGCPSWVRGRSVASMTSKTSLICPPPPPRMGRRSSALWRLIAAQAAAA